MISDKMQKAINEQIEKELYSEYLYLSMATYFAENNLDGFAHWFFKQAEEEHGHAMKFMRYLIERGGNVKVPGIAEPKPVVGKYIDFFNASLEHEKFITENIHNLMNLAIELNDHSAKNLLNWYVDEQVEEEASVEKVVAYLKMIGDNMGAIFMLNAELGKR